MLEPALWAKAKVSNSAPPRASASWTVRPGRPGAPPHSRHDACERRSEALDVCSVDAQPRLSRMAGAPARNERPSQPARATAPPCPTSRPSLNSPRFRRDRARSSASRPRRREPRIKSVLGSRGAVSAKTTASAATERIAMVRRSRSPESRAGSSPNSARHARAAAPKAAIAATNSVPARPPRS